jgi:L-2-hydroxyglutarate oxidase LhgO
MFDYIIIGSGIIGLAIARELKYRECDSRIAILEKEKDVGYHASGRNSGVLHSGFYYTEDSLKAKFTKEGNFLLQKYCVEKNIKINKCQKVVVAKDQHELEVLFELERRGLKNGVNVRIVDEEELVNIEPNAKTYKKALYSPDTATIDPLKVIKSIKFDLELLGVEFLFSESFDSRVDKNTIITSKNRELKSKKIINCAGLYSDKIAQQYNFSKKYTILPFKGIYLKYSSTVKDRPIKTNIYPVPNLNNPFLGVHYTITVDGSIKIGPTAIPALWRENYHGLEGFNVNEFLEILGYESKLFVKNSFNFRNLAYDELKKINKKYLISLAVDMVHDIDESKFTEWGKPGIRAQLLNTKTMELVQDFVIEGDADSVHVLNAVSPAFTCSLSFANWLVNVKFPQLGICSK